MIDTSIHNVALRGNKREIVRVAAEEILAKLGIEGVSHIVRVWNNHDIDTWRVIEHLKSAVSGVGR